MKTHSFVKLICLVLSLVLFACSVLCSCGKESSSTVADLSFTVNKEHYESGTLKKETSSYANGQVAKISEYNESGVLTSMIEYFEDGSVFREYTINESGVISQIKEYRRTLTNNTLVYCLYSISNYNDDGRLVNRSSSSRWEYGLSDFDIQYEYEYPEEGVIVQTTSYAFMSDVSVTTLTYEGKTLRRLEEESTSGVRDDGMVVVQTNGYTFDNNGNITEEYTEYDVYPFDNNGNVIERNKESRVAKYNYSYDEHNNIISVETDTIGVIRTYTNEYDSEGKLTKVTLLIYNGIDNSATNTVVYTYEDEYLIKSETYDSNGTLWTVEEFFPGMERSVEYISRLVLLVDRYKVHKVTRSYITYDNGKEIDRQEYYENETLKIPKKYWD